MLDQQKIDMFIMTNQKYFPEEKIVYLKDKLRTMTINFPSSLPFK